MVGIIKETGQVQHKTGEIVISKKMVAEIGVLLIVALVALAGIQTFQSAETLQKNTQQSGQNVFTGEATSSQVNNAGQEMNAGAYIPKFNANGANIQEIGFNNIPRTIPLVAGLVIRDLKVDGGYFYGYIKNTASETRSLETISFSYLDKNGIRTRYASQIEIQAYNSATKQNMWVGADNLPANQEYYFRATTMKNYDTENEIKFVQIYY